MVELRSDQTELIAELDRRIQAGKRRIVIQAPCGYGKTIVGGSLVNRELVQKRRTLFVVPAISLIDQTVDSFCQFGIPIEDIGVIQAQHELTNWDCPIQVCSVQTLNRRNIPDGAFVIIDEIHQFHEFYGKWLLDPKWRDVPMIGLSATPWRKGLGAYFTDLIVASTTAEMIDRRLLSDFSVYAPSSPDLKGVRTVAGDYHEGQLSERMNTAPLVADIVDTWLQRGEDRPTFCFAVNRLHAKHLQKQFEAKGIPTGYIDAYTKSEERHTIRRKFHAGEIKIVCNVGVLTTGVDWDVRCIVLARPTKSEILFVQIVGRGLRTAEGKDRLLILDHSDNHLRLGFVTDIHHDKLNDGSSPVGAKSDAIKLPKKCPQCSYLKPPKTQVCPACGFKAQAIDKTKVVDGELIELDRRGKKPKVTDLFGEEEFYRQLLGVAELRGYQPGWAFHKHIEKFGSKPPWIWREKGALLPSPATLNWVKSIQIRRAKSRFNEQASERDRTSSGPVAGNPAELGGEQDLPF